jgi:hypothetical protein
MESKFRQSAARMGADAVVMVADRTMLMGRGAMGPWWGRQSEPVYGRVIVGMAIRMPGKKVGVAVKPPNRGVRPVYA